MKKRKKENEGKEKRKKQTNLRMVCEVPGLNPGGNPPFLTPPFLRRRKESCPIRVNCKKKKKKNPIFLEKRLILCHEWCHILKLTHTASIIGRGNKKKMIVHLQTFRESVLCYMEKSKLYGIWRVQTPPGLDGKFQQVSFFDKA